MLKVKQIRKDINTNYLSSRTFTPASVRTKGYESEEGANTFDDFAINYDFENGKTYYLRFAARRKEVDSMDYGPEDSIKFNLVLYEKDGGGSGDHAQEKTQTIARDLILDPYVPEGYNKRWKSFTIVFTPNDAHYKFLSFKVNRIGYDYLNYDSGYRTPFIYSNEPITGDNTLNFTNEGDFAIINNILPNIVADKIGIQSDPGALFCVNKEPIYLGRSGVYEINNGTKISFVGVAAPNGDDNTNIQDFIFDYAYNE